MIPEIQADPPKTLWRVAYVRRETGSGTSVIDKRHADYFENEPDVLDLLRRLVPNGGRVLSIHKLGPVAGLALSSATHRRTELTYTPPRAYGILTPSELALAKAMPR